MIGEQHLRRLLGSRLVISLLSRFDISKRAGFLDVFWRTANRGLDPLDRFRLLRETLRHRRVDKYPVIASPTLARGYRFFHLVKAVAEVEGAIVEAGVGHGQSLAAMGFAVAYFGLDKTLYGFDSFSGFPEATPEDVGPRVRQAGLVTGWRDVSAAQVAELFEEDKKEQGSLLAEHDVAVRLIPGFFDETMPGELPEQIALLHVDCDLYAAYKTVLEHGIPRMASGGLIVFDEYDDSRWPGAARAVDEVCQQQGLDVVYFDEAQCYGVRLPAASPMPPDAVAPPPRVQ